LASAPGYRSIFIAWGWPSKKDHGSLSGNSVHRGNQLKQMVLVSLALSDCVFFT
jgi:hypothetical protein